MTSTRQSITKKPTINDVARISGLSKKTVSRVLNNSPHVAEKTRKRVAKVIEQLDYAPDPQARSLASKRSYLLGLVYDNPNALYISDIQLGILRVCLGAGYELIMHPCDFKNPQLIDEIKQFVSRARIGGLILLSPVSQMEELAQQLKSSQVPYVRISPQKIDAEDRVVVSNDRRGAELMTEYLVSIGHREIGFVTGSESNLSAQQKYEGFKGVLNENKLSLRKGLVEKGDNTFASGEKAGRFLLDRKNRPTAVFASNDAMALGVLKTAMMLGIKVPEELSVCGFDDSDLATVTWPDLTTVRQPVMQMGEAAANKLIAQVGGAPGDREPAIPAEPEVVVRHSTAMRQR